jgi:septum site-determining protein MinD
LPRTIGIISGKGGVGKTTLVANLGVALSRFNRKVTLVDCNITTSHLGFCFGLFYYDKTLNHVLRKEAFLKDATYPHPSGVSIIPASLEIEQLAGFDVNELKSSIGSISDADIVLLDSAPGFGREAMSVLNASTEVMFTTTPHMNAVADVVRGLKIIRQMDVVPTGIVLNMTRGISHELSAKDVQQLTGLPVIAEIPFDINVQRSLDIGVPTLLYRSSTPASIEIMKLASVILGECYTPPNIFSRIYDYLKSI